MAIDALAGIRVIDLTQVWAGPLAARMLADFGADVIKVESIHHPDRMRFTHLPKGPKTERDFNRGGYFHQYNRNKYGITLDLSKSKGKEAFIKLVAKSDVLIENYALRVQKNLGITYPELSKVNPGLIMLSMRGYGSSGPYKDGPAFGSTIEAMAGMKSLLGYGDGVPIYAGACIGDPVSGLYGAFTIMAALVHRRETGQGQLIDLSMHECVGSIQEEAVFEYTVNGNVPRQLGARHPYHAPYNSYRCRGEDSWIAITVTTEEEWHALKKVIRDKRLDDARFLDPMTRYQNQDELDGVISQWAAGQDALDATVGLQSAGVPAGAFLNGQQIFRNEHLRQRGYFWLVKPQDAGILEQVGPLVHLSYTPARLRMPPPGLGEHNEFVLKTIAGLSDRDITKLKEEGIIGDQPAY